MLPIGRKTPKNNSAVPRYIKGSISGENTSVASNEKREMVLNENEVIATVALIAKTVERMDVS